MEETTHETELEQWLVEITNLDTPAPPLQLRIYAQDEEAMFVCAQVLSAVYQ